MPVETPARSAVAITSQIGIESTPGTAVAANKGLTAIEFNPNLATQSKRFRPRGHKFPTLVVPHKVSGRGEYNGLLDYNHLPYILSGLFANPTATALGTSGGYERVYLPSDNQLEPGRLTYTTEKGDSIAVDKYPYCQLTSLTMELGQDDLRVSGNMIAQKPTFNQTQTPTPDIIVPNPVLRGEIDVFVDDTYATLGTTRLTDALSETFTLPEKWLEKWVHNTTVTSWKQAVETHSESIGMSIVAEKNSQVRAFLLELFGQDKIFLRVQAKGELIGMNVAIEVYNLIQLDMALEYDTTEEVDDEGGVYAERFNYAPVYDVDLQSALRFTVVNPIALL